MWELVSPDGVTPAGWAVCPLLMFPCAIKSRSSLLALAHPGSLGKRAVKRLWWWWWWYLLELDGFLLNYTLNLFAKMVRSPGTSLIAKYQSKYLCIFDTNLLHWGLTSVTFYFSLGSLVFISWTLTLKLHIIWQINCCTVY